MNEKLIKIIIITTAVFVVLLILLFLVASCSNVTPKLDDFDLKMANAAKKYYESHTDELPSEDKDTKTITLSKMIENGMISDPSTEETTCTGDVTVTNNNGNYLYTPTFNCGDDIKTTFLVDKIIDEQIVTEGHGLYQMGNEYVYRGETLNNYLELDGGIYRILRIKEDGTIRVIQTKANILLEGVTWDNRYNESRKASEGNNDFYINSISSRIKESLENAYKNDTIISPTLKPYLTTHEICYGKRSAADSSKDGSTECSIKLAGAPVSTIALYEYLAVSIDSNCNNALDQSCKNYNYLANIQSSYWTVTADAESTHKAFRINRVPSTSTCNNAIKVILTFNLDEKLVYKSGDGTSANPFKVI